MHHGQIAFSTLPDLTAEVNREASVETLLPMYKVILGKTYEKERGFMPKYLQAKSLVCAIFILALTFFPPKPSQAQADSGPFRVYLTFEDGPTAAYTPPILDILAEYNAKATFFVIGFQIESNEAILQRIILECHAIGDHLWQEPGVYAGAPDHAVQAS
ncbi:MAG: polysaccharide deacetylase family protein, partial [Anaerolineae bacterium]